jgi:hypothetical protein
MPMEMEREDKHRLMQQLVLEQIAIVVQSRPVEQPRHGYLNGKKFFLTYLDVCMPCLIPYRSPTDC